jgi:prophage regulatory protein
MENTTVSRCKQVMQKTGLPRSTLNLKISRGEFPAPISLGARAVGWLDSEVEAWIQARIAATPAARKPAIPAAQKAAVLGVPAAPILPGRRIEGVAQKAVAPAALDANCFDGGKVR